MRHPTTKAQRCLAARASRAARRPTSSTSRLTKRARFAGSTGAPRQSAGTAEGQRCDGIRRRRLLPDADRRALLDLRRSPTSLSQLRLPGVPRRGNTGRRRCEGSPSTNGCAAGSSAIACERDHKEHAAVRAAATFLKDNAHRFPRGLVPGNPTQLAMLAINVYEVFLDSLEGAERGEPPSDRDVIDAVIEKKRQLDAARPKKHGEG